MSVIAALEFSSRTLKEYAEKTFRAMLLTRALDEKMSKLVRQNKGGTFHLSVLGHEMIGAASGVALTAGKDWALPYYRDRACAIGLGADIVDLLATFLARSAPHHSGGRMMPEHFSHKPLNIPCQSSCVGSQFLQAVGVAYGLKISGSDAVVYVSAGDGATSQGDFHEALNMAALHRLNVLFVIQDNGWAISVPSKEQTAGGSIVPIAEAYPGLSVFDVDGCDFKEVIEALDQAICKGRRKEGPSLIVAKVPRIGAHSSSDDPSKYKSKEQMAAAKELDPMPRMQAWLIDQGYSTESEIEALKETIFKEVEEATLVADAREFPDPARVTDHLFKETEEIILGEDCDLPAADGVVIMDALNHALDEEMARDEGVVIFGQDVAHGKGGVFGITRGLTEKYGTKRCFNTPLAESTIIALALGISLVDGFKPVAEVQFADYLWTGINQLFNELSTFHYRSNGEWNCPVVLRMPYGGYIQGGPYHSQSIEAFLAHAPGMKVVIPSNASDAKRLLKAAIKDPNPVIFLEHKGLYRQRVFCARKEPKEDEILPLGVAKCVREGRDVTCVCYGMMVVMAYEVAERLSLEGISVEVIDLRTIVPLDLETILLSIKKTGKVLITHEAARNCGFGAEIAAQIAEVGFAYLDAPIQRLAGKDCPVPYSKGLEDAVLPQREDLEKALRSLAQF